MARSLEIEVKQMNTLPGKKGCAETMSVQIQFLKTVERKRTMRSSVCLQRV